MGETVNVDDANGENIKVEGGIMAKIRMLEMKIAQDAEYLSKLDKKHEVSDAEQAHFKVKEVPLQAHNSEELRTKSKPFNGLQENTRRYNEDKDNRPIMVLKASETFSIINQHLQCISPDLNRNQLIDKAKGTDKIKEVDKFLRNQYASKYLLFTSNADAYKSAQAVYVNLSEFSISECLRVSRIAACWLELQPDGVCVLELSLKRKDTSLLIASILLAHGQSRMSVLHSFNYLVKILEESSIQSGTLPNKAVVQRYVKYFDTFVQAGDKYCASVVALHQAILYSPQSLGESLFLNIKDSSTTSVKIKENYKDANFRIYSGIDFIVNGETKIEICKEINKNMKDPAYLPILFIPINGLFYQQGVYRFNFNELVINQAIMSREECFVDLIFIGIDKPDNILEVKTKPTIEDLTNIAGIINLPENQKIKETLEQEGYMELTAKLVSQLAQNSEEGMQMAAKLLKYQPKKTIQVKKEVEKKEALPLSVLYDSNIKTHKPETFRLRCLTEINEKDFLAVKTETVKPVRSFLKRRNTEASIEFTGQPAQKPLHWSIISSTLGTLFSEMKGISIYISQASFERAFCGPIEEKTKTNKIENRGESHIQGVLNDARRVFLVSLSLRHLELQGLDVESICKTINNEPERLSTQDLLNIERAIPTEVEAEILETAASGLLTVTERAMLSLAKDPFAKPVTEILIFERKCRDELSDLEEYLDEIIVVFKVIIESYNLKMLFKAILDVGNLINISVRKRKADGFKLESLRLLQTYSGAGSYSGPNGNGFIKFLVEVLRKNKMDILELFSEFNVLNKLCGERYDKISLELNMFIRRFNQIKEVIADFPVNEGKKYYGFAACAMNKLEQISKKCKESLNLSTNLRKRFGEDMNAPISHIMNIIKDLVNEVKKEYYRCTS